MKMEVAKGSWDPHIFSLIEQFVRSGTADFLSRGAGGRFKQLGHPVEG
jgi:hypothetical protein